MVNKVEMGKFLALNNGRRSSSHAAGCFSRWWHQEFHSQEVISCAIESFYFHVLIIFLVVLDTALVVTEILLDSFKIHYECEFHTDDAHKSHYHSTIIHLEFAIEVAHYLSIGILVFFVIELLVRIFASGREFWNIRRRKMEYFDAFIVVTSLIIDLSFLRGENKLLGEELVLVLAFRLWRFVRIISSVTEATLHRQRKHKDHLNQQYLNAIRRLVNLLVHKTNYAEKNANEQNLGALLEHFQNIDQQCQSSLEALSQNRELTSSAVVEQFVYEISGLENKNSQSIISAMFAKSSEV
ncbi:unnamed protein product [Adineta ricciae]|uniref:Voltage-gated hydrogen channel 1 n=1 Tax=Adineta ricciae TaxID=249248 RepID=A0A815ZGL4_ADIRI|nr:unnamed protein product [Adineta ricciae]